jgi:hypothetical protein
VDLCAVCAHLVRAGNPQRPGHRLSSGTSLSSSHGRDMNSVILCDLSSDDERELLAYTH